MVRAKAIRTNKGMMFEMDKSWLQEPILGFEMTTLDSRRYEPNKDDTKSHLKIYSERVVFDYRPEDHWARATSWYQKAAVQKEPLAVQEVKRIEEFKAAEQKAKNGDADAQYMLALYYFYKYGIYEDYGEGSVWMRKAVINGSKVARESFYEWFSDEDIDLDDVDFLPPVIIPKGFKFVDLKERHGKINSRHSSKYCIDVSPELYSGLDFKETEKAACKGDSEKQYQLAWLYDRGYGIQQDMKKAISWFVISAYNGYAPAQTELGIMYQHGIEATTVSLEIFGKGTVLEKST